MRRNAPDPSLAAPDAAPKANPAPLHSQCLSNKATPAAGPRQRPAGDPRDQISLAQAGMAPADFIVSRSDVSIFTGLQSLNS